MVQQIPDGHDTGWNIVHSFQMRAWTAAGDDAPGYSQSLGQWGGYTVYIGLNAFT
jgi:hypothetical protein